MPRHIKRWSYESIPNTHSREEWQRFYLRPRCIGLMCSSSSSPCHPPWRSRPWTPSCSRTRNSWRPLKGYKVVVLTWDYLSPKVEKWKVILLQRRCQWRIPYIMGNMVPKLEFEFLSRCTIKVSICIVFSHCCAMKVAKYESSTYASYCGVTSRILRSSHCCRWLCWSGTHPPRRSHCSSAQHNGLNKVNWMTILIRKQSNQIHFMQTCQNDG